MKTVILNQDTNRIPYYGLTNVNDVEELEILPFD